MYIEDALEDWFCEENGLNPKEKRRRKFLNKGPELEDEVFDDSDCCHNK